VAAPTPEELQAAGLYDPDDPLAADRLELIAYLLECGATLDDLVAANPDLAGVASTIALRGGGERFTVAEAAARAGIAVETAARIWRAAGFPDPGPDARVCNDEDVLTLQTFDAGARLLGEDVVLQMVRVIGSSMARIADATIGAFLVNVAAPSLEEDPGGMRLARANTEAVTLLRAASGAMDVIFRRHVERLQRPLSAGDQRTQGLAIGFADLVGSTALAQQLSTKELGGALEEFDEVVSDVVVTNGGRVVKLIGDEVMFVAAEPGVACAIGRAIASRLADHPRLPPVRVGVTFGPVLSRDGDYFGSVVNLAARMAKLADPGTVVVSDDVRRAVETETFVSVGTRNLKGFEHPVELFVLRG
jgi:class 3 adenylate cyclase